jgi:NAD(P)H-hydrate epimerase
MTEPLPETASGAISRKALDRIRELASTRSVIAAGPGIGAFDETRSLIQELFASLPKPLVLDADGLNCIAGTGWKGGDHLRVLTPHPGEMSRLADAPVAAIQADRVTAARSLATQRNATIVLKGEGTLTAFPDGNVWINPTGSPAMATGGTGDILTGMIAGLLGQFPDHAPHAIAAGVWLHGRAGELAAAELGQQPVIATDLLRFFGEGIREIASLADAD